MNTNLKFLVIAAVAVLTSPESIFSANTTWTWTGASSSSWSTKSNWTTTDNNSSIGNGDTAIINSGLSRYPVLGSNRTIAKLVLNGGTIDLDGDKITVNTVILFNGGTIINTGNSDDVQMNDVVVNFNGTFQIPSNVQFSVEGNMQFINGKLATTNSNFIEFADNSTVSGASPNSHIIGSVRKIGNDAFVFPLGDGTYYAPIAISAPQNAGHHFTASYFNTAYTDLTVKSSLDHVNSTEYWRLNRTSGSSQVNVTLYYVNPRSGNIDNLSTLRLASYDGTDWISVGSSVSGSLGSGTITTSSALNSFSFFTAGSSSTLNPLPVRLIDFNAIKNSESIFVNWSSTEELNCKEYQLEKSIDGINWSTITSVESIRITASINKYSFNDENPVNGVQFYRLKLVDYDETYTYSKLASIDLSVKQVVSIYPNPAKTFTSLIFDNSSESHSVLNIYSMEGKLILQIENYLSEDVLDVSNVLPGIYQLELQLGNSIFTHKLKID